MPLVDGPLVEYDREGYVHVEHVVYLSNGEQHTFPMEEWARWFMAKHQGSTMLKTTRHTLEGLHAGQRQGPAK